MDPVKEPWREVTQVGYAMGYTAKTQLDTATFSSYTQLLWWGEQVALFSTAGESTWRLLKSKIKTIKKSWV